MTSAIRQDALGRGVTRLCHLTPARNLVHIARDLGLRSTAQLLDSERREFNQQDLIRLDRHPDHICCSVEYPNGWYLRARRQASGEARLFPDWVCLCIVPDHVWAPGTLFSQRNAAADGGRWVAAGPVAFSSLYDHEVRGGGRIIRRTPTRLSACPTDDQAEVLVPRQIPIEDVLGVLVGDESQARRLYAGLDQVNGAPERFRYGIVSEIFATAPGPLSTMIQQGHRPAEISWQP